MNREDIIRMTKEAGFHHWYSGPEHTYHFGCIERFAELVAATEREACAKVCDNLDAMSNDPMVAFGTAKECAEAIRARSNK